MSYLNNIILKSIKHATIWSNCYFCSSRDEVARLVLSFAVLSCCTFQLMFSSVWRQLLAPMLVGRAELCVGDSHPSISSWLFQAQWVRRSQFYYSHLHPAWSALQTATTGITVYYRSTDRKKSQGCVCYCTPTTRSKDCILMLFYSAWWLVMVSPSPSAGLHSFIMVRCLKPLLPFSSEPQKQTINSPLVVVMTGVGKKES